MSVVWWPFDWKPNLDDKRNRNETIMSKNDKSKSGGGLLDIWFGRPKTKGRGGTTNGGRPISSESDTIGDMQELHNEIMKLTVDEIDQKFTEILEDMNIPKDKRQPLLKKSLDEKRDMILMHFKGEQLWYMRFKIECV